MLRLSKKMLFAIEAVLDIAFHAGSLPVQSRTITRRHGIPRRYLEQALQHLVREGVLIGVRGPKGGYRLARERRRITVGDIVRVIRKMEIGNDPAREDSAGSELGRKVVRTLWQELQDEIIKKLDDITIDDMCNRAHDAKIISEGRSNLDFSI
ncbi:MAG TPA: Rrf2 family transcriptional regulator [Rhodospirillales bacterium]|jgi:Rrf2 family protein|nr:Rrf2 family transcriptional regulator [Rhodospirillaceae bacterium]HJN23690.1 Rrf2 family transcriptional regulator [Rhodospirillales bacterium]